MRIFSLIVLVMILPSLVLARCELRIPRFSISQARAALESSAKLDNTTYATKFVAFDTARDDAEIAGNNFEVLAKSDSLSLLNTTETPIINVVQSASTNILSKLADQNLAISDNHQLAEPLIPSNGTYTYADVKDYWLQMSDEDLVEAAELRLLNKCYIGDAVQASCTNCACGKYVKALNPAGNTGLPSGTGCAVKSQNTFGGAGVINNCFSGYTTGMCTGSLESNMAEQLRDGIRSPSDPCGISGYVSKLNEAVVGLNYESSESTYNFAYDSSGKIRCYATVSVDIANNLSSGLLASDGSDGDVLVAMDQNFCHRFYMRKYKLGLVEGASVTVPEIAATLTPAMEVADQTQSTLANMSKNQIKQKYNILQPIEESTHDTAAQNLTKQIDIAHIAGVGVGRLEVFQSETVIETGSLNANAGDEVCTSE